MKLAMVFPGQGAQSVGMMNSLADFAVTRALFEQASAVLGFDLWRLAQEGPAEEQSLTINTQPLMLSAGVAAYRVWRELGGPPPVVVAGHSLGEYAALVAAGALEFGAAVGLVRRRAEAMERAVPAGTGAMAAILGLDDAAIEAICAEVAGGEVLEAVNYNADGQVVIAGHAAAVARGVERLKARGAKRAVLLPVSGPFHSSLMRPAADAIAAEIEATPMQTPPIAVLQNAEVALPADVAALKGALLRQIYRPVRWGDTVRKMLTDFGADIVAECAPGKVLFGLNRRIAAEAQHAALGDRAAMESLLGELGA
jgi:[acyl-carrier-protein] S-malonyltransferase